MAAFGVVVVAASLGGRAVIEEVLAPLPRDFPAAILVVQHIRGDQPSYLAELLARRLQLAVHGATMGARLLAGHVYTAVPGRHLVIARTDDGVGACVLSDGLAVNFSRPSADPLFASAAEAFGARALGVVLTGALCDGAAGADALRAAGGTVIAQLPSTCRAAGMPLAAIRRDAVDHILAPAAITAALVRLVR